MIIPTEEQIIDRWDSLPMSLKEALTSEANSDLIWKISEAEHVPDEKIYGIGGAVSHVLFGFIHPEDVAAELKDGLQLNPQTVTSIADQLNQKIFAPLQQDINQAYQPLTKMAGGPKIMQDLKPMPIISATATPGPKMAPAPMPTSAVSSGNPAKPLGQVTSQTAAGLNINASPLASNKNNAAPAPQAPKIGSNAGWSKQEPQNPVVKLGVITPSIPAPTNASASPKPATTQPTPSQQITVKQFTTQPPKGISEFERLDAMKKMSAGQTPSAAMPTPPQPAQPAPVMLHEVANPAQLQSSPNFKFNQVAQNQINASAPKNAMPTKPAMIELPSTGATKVVHYSDYKTPIPAPTADASGPRAVTEVTAAPPMPAPAPKPPEKPENKVIVQNFLGPQK